MGVKMRQGVKRYMDQKSSDMAKVEGQLIHVLKQLSSFNRWLQQIGTVVTWMGIDVKDQVNHIIEEASHSPNKFAIGVALKLWGNRNLKYWVINNNLVAKKKKRSMRAKDPTDILWRFTFMLHKKQIPKQAAIKQIQSDKAIPFQQKEENLLEANKINKLKGAYHQINQFGLDCWKKKYHQKQCLYCELVENGAKPGVDWTIQKEINLASMKDEARNVEIIVKEESLILNEIDRLTREAWGQEN
uniref:Uncharacterized protein n=1 Tax=Romanomermis culicivorax TaxID=13658 RepID=A0A915JQH7_ROMCU